MRSKEDYIRLFQKLGVKSPESWATGDIQENLGNLAKVAFLRQAWNEIPGSADTTWLGTWIEHSRKLPASTDVVAAYDKLVAMGASPGDLMLLMRSIMGEFLFRVCYLLDDPSLEDPELQETISWGLYEETNFGRRRMGCIHELVWEVDPEEA